VELTSTPLDSVDYARFLAQRMQEKVGVFNSRLYSQILINIYRELTMHLPS
jgi:hypothetical protein